MNEMNLKCDWSVELVKDLSSFHNLDVESEIEKLLHLELKILLHLELKISIRRQIRKKKIENLMKHTC